MGDHIDKAPDMSGHARAWKVDMDAMRKTGEALGVDLTDDATVSLWVVEAPWAHLAWHSYILTLIHLRPNPSGKAVTINLPGATHELFLYALNPDGRREPLILGKALLGPDSVGILTPANFVAQFIEPSDEAAAARVEATVKEIVDGQLSPDTDYLRQWVARYGDSNIIKDRFA